ncbi:MAG: hypothetical protein EAZ08_10925 [Cytophagales bacterium]|nr:MAG: hypothetical protein EAZ08_10925 [Cytophagales bacterium]
MKITEVYIENFKNLDKFHIYLTDDENLNKMVMVGQNGAGKSNFLEALVLIFRDLLYDENTPPFKYAIKYICSDKKIEISANPDNAKNKYKIVINGAELKSKTTFNKRHKVENLLPRYVFAYYSGFSNRLEEHFDKSQNKFYDDLLAGKDEPFRPLFYAQPVHSNFVLLAFYAFQDKETRLFLENHLNIVGLESALFVIKEPNWHKGKKREEGNIKFWYSKGFVSTFLDHLFKKSLAPIKHTIEIRTDFRHKPTPTECWYLYLESQEKLEELASEYTSNVDFFKALESTYISDLIHETRIKVRKKDAAGNITFKELSEGEQQLLMVLGLLKFTKNEESLFLLDEPDTHLNPLWEYKYLDLLDKVVGDYKNSQMIMSTHHALTIGSLEKEQIRVFFRKDGKIDNYMPHINPKGMSIDGILTSDIFGLTTTIDKDTYEEILKRRRLFSKKLDLEKKGESLSKEEAQELQRITEEMGTKSMPYHDPLFWDFIAAMKESDYDVYKITEPLSEENKQERLKKAKEAYEKAKKQRGL